MMRSYYKNMMLAAALLSAAAACTKEGPGTDPLDGVPISISATAPETKAMLDAYAFKHDGNRIIIYDFVDNATTPYFSDLIGPDVNGSEYANSQKPDGVWPFVNGPHQWTPGTHNFFGWLVKDVNKTTETTDDLTPVSLFGDTFATSTVTENNTTNVTVAAFGVATRTLDIPATEINAASPQFDFMYSDIYSTEPQNDPVDLKFSHLFTAISFGFLNNSSNTVTVSNLDVKMYTKQTAAIYFSAGAVAYAGRTALDYFYGNGTDSFTDVTVPAKTTTGNVTTPGIVNYAFDINASAPNYLLSWPMSEDLDKCSIEITFKYNASGEKTQSQSLKFPAGTLLPGKKYHFNIAFADKAPVKINYLVVGWADIENNVTFE